MLNKTDTLSFSLCVGLLWLCCFGLVNPIGLLLLGKLILDGIVRILETFLGVICVFRLSIIF